MAPLRRVFGERAGPSALGILVPPHPRTILVLRPRSLAWDLVLTQDAAEPGAGLAFQELPREAAETLAQQLCRALEEWAGGGAGQVDVVALANGQGFGVQARVGTLPLVACLRQPGQAYRLLAFAAPDEARQAATALADVLCPAAGGVQEVYFNTRHFSR